MILNIILIMNILFFSTKFLYNPTKWKVVLNKFLYINFIMSFFSYFTDPLWYQKTRTIDYIQLSHEPLKWGWGSSKRDHFSYHKISTVFWYKNDIPFAGAFLLLNFFCQGLLWDPHARKCPHYYPINFLKLKSGLLLKNCL